MFLHIPQLHPSTTVWDVSCCSKLFHLILMIFSQMRKQRLTQLKKWQRSMMGIQFPQPPKALAINHAASNPASTSCGAGVPELLTGVPAVTRVRCRAKVHMTRKQKQASYSPLLRPQLGSPESLGSLLGFLALTPHPVPT